MVRERERERVIPKQSVIIIMGRWEEIFGEQCLSKHVDSFFLLGITNVVDRNRSESAIGDLVSALSERLREGDRKPRTGTTTTTTTAIHYNLLLRPLLQRSDSNLSPLVLRRCRFSLTTTLSLPFHFFNRRRHFLYKIFQTNQNPNQIL